MPDEPNATSPAPATESGQPSNVTTANGGTAIQDSNAWPTTNLEPGDLTSFLSLRDSIHVFEWVALKAYMSANTVELRDERANIVAELVKDFKTALLQGEGCPPGFTATANGRCVAGG